MKFSGKMWLNIKSHKEQGFTLFAENANSEKATNTVKIWSKRTLSEISEFSILGIEQNRTLSFCLNSFMSFLNLKLQLLSKFKVIWSD